jgi:hypothetical protein
MEINGDSMPWGLEQPGYNDSAWLQAGIYGHDSILWTLKKRPIPFMEEKEQFFSHSSCPGKDSNFHDLKRSPGPQPGASTNSATWA